MTSILIKYSDQHKIGRLSKPTSYSYAYSYALVNDLLTNKEYFIRGKHNSEFFNRIRDKINDIDIVSLEEAKFSNKVRFFVNKQHKVKSLFSDNNLRMHFAEFMI